MKRCWSDGSFGDVRGFGLGDERMKDEGIGNGSKRFWEWKFGSLFAWLGWL